MSLRLDARHVRHKQASITARYARLEQHLKHERRQKKGIVVSTNARTKNFSKIIHWHMQIRIFDASSLHFRFRRLLRLFNYENENVVPTIPWKLKSRRTFELS